MQHSVISLELSQKALFPACYAVLETAQRPLHFRALTLEAFARLGVRFDQNVFRQALLENEENVREKFLKKRWNNLTFYLGDPHCLGGLRRWFQTPQLQLFHTDEVTIPGHAQAGADGAFESVMRFEHLQQKNPYASQQTRIAACATGFVLEAHVKEFFARMYPTLFSLPDNAGQYLRWDRNDFYLHAAGQQFGIDVFGPNKHGEFKRAPGKPVTDIHIAAGIRADVCVLKGVMRGRDLGERFIPETSFSPINFMVWLNCLRDNLPYALLTEAAS